MHMRTRDPHTVRLWQAPVIAAQALWLRNRRPVLSCAGGLDHGVIPGPGRPSFRLAIVGESTAAGVGVSGHDDGIAGALARRVRDALGREVAWTARGAQGSTVRLTRHHVIPQLDNDYHLVVLLAGVSDVINGETLADWSIDIAAAVEDLAVRNRHVLVAGMPPLRDFPQLPSPLAEFLDRRGQEMDVVTARIASGRDNVTFASSRPPKPLDPTLFAADGMHMTAAGYAGWADALLAEYLASPSATSAS